MAYEVTIGGEGTLFVGEDKVLRLELVDASSTPLPQDMTGWSMIFDVRLKDNSATAIISVVPILIGAFNAVRALNTQRALVTLTDDLMNLFKAKTYRYSWKRMDAGVETVLMYGPFVPQKATAP